MYMSIHDFYHDLGFLNIIQMYYRTINNKKKICMKKFAQEKIVILLTTIPVKFICLYLFIFYTIFLCAIYGKQEVNSIETKPSEYHWYSRNDSTKG